MMSAQTTEAIKRPAKERREGFSLYKLTWIFVIGCVAGYLVEMSWCYIRHGYFESRQGVLYGPFSPVYGFGGVLLTLCLYNLRKRSGVLIFFVSLLLGGAFEYFCSLFQELAFGTVSWDYSRDPLNFGGRTSLKYALYWGVLGLVFIKFVYPFLEKMIGKLRRERWKWVMLAAAIFLAFDLTISAFAVSRLMQRSEGLPPQNVIARFLDEHFPDERMKQIYPNMRPAPSQQRK